MTAAAYHRLRAARLGVGVGVGGVVGMGRRRVGRAERAEAAVTAALRATNLP